MVSALAAGQQLCNYISLASLLLNYADSALQMMLQPGGVKIWRPRQVIIIYSLISPSLYRIETCDQYFSYFRFTSVPAREISYLWIKGWMWRKRIRRISLARRCNTLDNGSVQRWQHSRRSLGYDGFVFLIMNFYVCYGVTSRLGYHIIQTNNLSAGHAQPLICTIRSQAKFSRSRTKSGSATPEFGNLRKHLWDPSNVLAISHLYHGFGNNYYL